MANNGGLGKATSLFLRGTESDHVLVLVDGIKLGSATAGGASIQDIPVEQIERIEIVRGPFSSLYGSEAIGGVIQIFTRRPEGRVRAQRQPRLRAATARYTGIGRLGRAQRQGLVCAAGQRTTRPAASMPAASARPTPSPAASPTSPTATATATTP